MKKLVSAALLSLFALSATAKAIDCNELAGESLQVSKSLGKLVILPKQPLACRAKLTQASSEVAVTSGLIQAKANKLARKGLEHSVLTLASTATLGCEGFEQITEAEAKLVGIATKLPV